jgi:hypothetical protein
MKNSNDTIGNRSRDLPVCRAVPQLLIIILYTFHPDTLVYVNKDVRIHGYFSNSKGAAKIIVLKTLV